MGNENQAERSPCCLRTPKHSGRSAPPPRPRARPRTYSTLQTWRGSAQRLTLSTAGITSQSRRWRCGVPEHTSARVPIGWTRRAPARNHAPITKPAHLEHLRQHLLATLFVGAINEWGVEQPRVLLLSPTAYYRVKVEGGNVQAVRVPLDKLTRIE